MKVIHDFITHQRNRYRVIFQKKITKEGVDCDGLCDPPDDEVAIIKIKQGLPRKELIETLIHEMAHAFFFDKSETNITRFAKSVVTLLRRMNLLLLKTQYQPQLRKASNKKNARHKK